nr:hypothetical protein [Tanacetum cinerariifolium]
MSSISLMASPIIDLTSRPESPKVSKAVIEVVTDAIDWAMQAPLQKRFRDLPKANMKEILHQRMLETESYKTHEDHTQLFEALEKSMNHDHSKELAQDWWKPLEEERPATPEPAWSIPSSDAPRRGITELKPQDLEGHAFKIVKVFHPDVIHLQYQMEECHKLLTDSMDDPILRHNVSKPLPLGGPPGQVIIQSDFFFNKDLEYLRYGSKGSQPALSISKMKAAYYPNAGLEQMVPDYAVRTHMQILSVVRIKVFFLYGSLEPPPTERQEDSLYGRQPIDQTSGSSTSMTTPSSILQELSCFEINMRFKYEVLDQEGRRSKQDVYVLYSEALEDKEDLPQPRELCWWMTQRGILQTSNAYRMINSFRHSRTLSADL